MAVHGKTDRNEERAINVQEDGSVVVATDGQPLAVATKIGLPLSVEFAGDTISSGGSTDSGEEAAVRVLDDGSVVVATDGQPLAVTNKASHPLSVRDVQLMADGNVHQTVSISSTAATMTLPESGGVYLVLAINNACFLRWDGGTCTTAAGGFSIVAPEGVPLNLRIPGNMVSHIGSTTGGTITILHLKQV